MSKAKEILTLLSKGKTIKEVAKATKSSEAYVYYVRWTDKKGKPTPKKAKKKAVYKSDRSKIVQAVFETKKALDAIEAKPVELLRMDTNGHLRLGTVTPKTKIDVVNHPPHYTAGGVETLDFIEAKDLNYRLGNVVKYVSRAGKKDTDPVQDLEKAMFYLKREIEARRNA